MGRKILGTAAAAGILALALAAAYGPARLDRHSIYSAVIQDITNLDGFYAWDLFTASELQAGRAPLWNPHNAFGTPHLANVQTAMFYPLNWLKFALGFWNIIDWVLLLRLWFAGLFTYLFARRALRASFWPALIGGAAFMLGGYFTRFVYMSHLNVEILLPLQLLLLHLLHERATAPRLAGAGLGFGLLILGGFPEATLYAVVLAVTYLFALEGLNRRAAVLAGAALALGLIVSLAQWLPFAEYLPQAWTYHDVDSGLRHLDPKFSITLILPWFFGDNHASPVASFTAPYLGAGVVLLALHQLFRPRDARRETVFFAAAAVIALGLVYGLWPVSELGGLYPFSVTYNDKYALPVLTLAVALLAAGGAELLVREQPGARFPFLALGLLALMGGAVYLGLPPRHYFKPAYALGLLTPGVVAGPAALVALMAVLAFMRSRELLTARAFAAGLFALVLMGLLYDQTGNRPDYHDGFQKTAANLMRKFEDSGGKYRVNVDPNIEPLAADRLLPLGIDDLRSYEPLYPASYVAFMAELNGLKGENLLAHYHDHMLFTVNRDRLDDPLLHLVNVFVHVLPYPENERPFPDDWAAKARTISPRRESWLRYDYFVSGGESRRGLMEHGPVRIEGPLPPAPGEGASPRLLFSAGVPDAPREGQAGDGVNLLALSSGKTGENLAYARYLDPARRRADAGWHPVSVAVSTRIGLLILPGPHDDRTRDAAVFGEPRMAGTPGWSGLEPIGDGRDGFHPYQDPKALPRAWWISGLAPIPADRDFMDSLHQAARTNPDIFRDLALTAGSVELTSIGQGLTIEVKKPVFETKVFQPGRMEFRSLQGREGFIFVSAQYFPGLQARAVKTSAPGADSAHPGASPIPAPGFDSGLDLKIIRANGPFMAVPVPPGDWTVEVLYRPWSFRIGLWAMLAGVAASLAGLSLGMRRRSAACSPVRS